MSTLLAALALVICPITSVRDGDTLYCGATSDSPQIRLEGINAVERNQVGYFVAKQELEAITKGGPVICRWSGKTSYNRLNAYCDDAKGVDIGLQLLRLHTQDRVVVEWCFYSMNHYGTCPSDHNEVTWTNTRPN